jgi:hypothetical protein
MATTTPKVKARHRFARDGRRKRVNQLTKTGGKPDRLHPKKVSAAETGYWALVNKS